MGLASFADAVDCAAANNGLKRRRMLQRGEFGYPPELAPNIRIKIIFLTRDDCFA
jgi:hypothetical protein